MKPLDWDMSILRHIIFYCKKIKQTVEHFKDTYESFCCQIYRNVSALCILKIGELVGKLTDTFRAQNPIVSWRQIKAVRNIAVHSYGLLVQKQPGKLFAEIFPS